MSGPVVIVIEDEMLILADIEDALIAGGFRVIACTRGTHAMAHIEGGDEQIVALVTDIRFAGDSVSGWDVARRARELMPSIGVVYISGDSGIDWRAQGVPGSCFVQKPFASAQIVTAVAQALNANSQPTE